MIREFIEQRCWSESKSSYVRYPGSDELDSSVLLPVMLAFGQPSDPRLRSTVEAIQRELVHGPYVYRYSGEDGLSGQEGAFLTCSFWLVGALAFQGRRQEAVALMAELVRATNDVGLFSEEVDPATGEFLGNVPQGLTHLALINAAHLLEEVEQR
jgi:GH15 family glucan-1,4-alpha-glucosidase